MIKRKPGPSYEVITEGEDREKMIFDCFFKARDFIDMYAWKNSQTLDEYHNAVKHDRCVSINGITLTIQCYNDD